KLIAEGWSLLCAGLLAAGDSLTRSLAATGIGARTLTVDRQTAAVAHPAVAVDLHQPLDVQVDFPPQVTFDGELAIHDLAQARDLVFAEIARAPIGGNGGP